MKRRDCIDPIVRLEKTDAFFRGLMTGKAVVERGRKKREVEERGRRRLASMEKVLAKLGNPERQYPQVHVAGTSGKGSVTQFIAQICMEAGMRTGLHQTPYLQVSLEKLLVNGEMPSMTKAEKLIEAIKEKCSDGVGGEPLQYGPAWVGITMEHFRREQVEMAVIETGAGGRYDLTNVLAPCVAVVTRVGMDHVYSLGPTLRDIAGHKGGIFKAGAAAVALYQEGAVEEVLRRCATDAGVQLRQIKEGRDYSVIDSGTDKYGLLYKGRLKGDGLEVDQVGMSGRHQVENAALACAAAEEMASQGYPITVKAMSEGLKKAKMAGRWEVVAKSPAIILDGAHNKDKARAVAETLARYAAGRTTAVVVGVSQHKNSTDILRALAGLAEFVVATEASVYKKPGHRAEKLAQTLAEMGSCSVAERDPNKALSEAVGRVGSDGVVLVTGSMFLVGQIRNMFYPKREMLEKASVWAGTKRTK